MNVAKQGPALLGGFYWDLDGSGSYEAAGDFGTRPWLVTSTSGTKSYTSSALAAAVGAMGIYPTSPPAHLSTLAETQAFWAPRSGVLWIDEVVQGLPGLLFLVYGSEQDHVQVAIDYPHILTQYEAFRTAGAALTRLNPDRSYVEAVMGSAPGAQDHPAGKPFDHQSIRTAMEPESIPVGMGVAAAACELADRSHAGVLDAQLDQAIF
jgi:hypothetical protein